MKRSTQCASAPGTLFLRLIRPFFAADTVAAVFCPAVADFQDELRQEPSSRTKQLLTRCRWCWALVMLLVVTPFSMTRRSTPLHEREIDSGALIMLLYVPLTASMWWCVQVFAGTALVAGAVLASVIHVSNRRHAGGVLLRLHERSRLAAAHNEAMPRAGAELNRVGNASADSLYSSNS